MILPRHAIFCIFVTLVSGNAVDEENLHPGDRKFILFSSLVSFVFFYCFYLFNFFFFCLFFEIKNLYSDTASTMRAGE